jgi:hypothetical protein
MYTSKYHSDISNFRDLMEWIRSDVAYVNFDECGNEYFEIKEHGLEDVYRLILREEREAIIDLVAFHGGSVELEAAIRSRGKL